MVPEKRTHFLGFRLAFGFVIITLFYVAFSFYISVERNGVHNMSEKVNRWAAGLPWIILGLVLAIFGYKLWHDPAPWLRPHTLLGPYPMMYIGVGIVVGAAEVMGLKWSEKSARTGRWITGILLVFLTLPFDLFGYDPLMMVAMGIYCATLGAALVFGVIWWKWA
jgi:hypothetical protein